MKKILLMMIILFSSSCGYHLRSNNSIAETYPLVKLDISAQSLLKRPLINALISSGVELTDQSNLEASEYNADYGGMQVQTRNTRSYRHGRHESHQHA